MTKRRGQLATSFMISIQLQQCKNWPCSILIKFEIDLEYKNSNKALSLNYFFKKIVKCLDTNLKF